MPKISLKFSGLEWLCVQFAHVWLVLMNMVPKGEGPLCVVRVNVYEGNKCGNARPSSASGAS